MDGKPAAERDAIDAETADPNDNSDYSRVDDDDGNVNIQCVSNGLQVISDCWDSGNPTLPHLHHSTPSLHP